MAGLNSIALNAGFDAASYIPFSAGNAAGGKSAAGFSGLIEKALNNKSPVDPEKLSGEEKKLFEACRELETFLVKNMLKGMRSTVMKSKLVDTGFAGEVYEDMLWDEYAKEYSKKAGMGLAELAFLELQRQHKV